MCQDLLQPAEDCYLAATFCLTFLSVTLPLCLLILVNNQQFLFPPCTQDSETPHILVMWFQSLVADQTTCLFWSAVGICVLLLSAAGELFDPFFLNNNLLFHFLHNCIPTLNKLK